MRRPQWPSSNATFRLTIQRIHPSQPSPCLSQRARLLSTSSLAQAQVSHPDNHDLSSGAQHSPQTLTEKIVQRYAVGLPKGKLVRSGDYISLAPQYCMTHDNSFPVSVKFMSMGAKRVRRPQQIVMTLDHDVQNTSPANLEKYRRIESFAAQQGIDFYPAGRGIGHQIMVEEGYAWPGTMAVASDSHSNHYGGVGCLGTPVVRTDAASIWATSRTWWQIPPIAQVTFTGTLPKGVTGKDVIVAFCGLFNSDVLNHAVEFTGSEETMSSLAVDSRLTIANMSTEWGALTGLFPIDRTLERWLRSKAAEAVGYNERTTRERISDDRIDQLYANPLTADKGAQYAKQLYLDLSTLSPYVSGPNSVKVATPLAELAPKKIKINRAYIVSCTNSRASDLAAAAKVVKDAAKANPNAEPKIADGVQLYIAAASAPEQKAAEAANDWQALLDAGAQPLPAGCGPCIGLGRGLLEPGEVGISASNRNFKGRMGSRDAQAYLASPEVVAASALSGVISGPDAYKVPSGWDGVVSGYGLSAERGGDDKASQESAPPTQESESDQSTSRATTEILPGFPERISGEIVFCDTDNLDTDAIYPGKMTYQDNVSKEDMAHACMQNYDPEFRGIAKAGDIVVGGWNFGCGSSREQAATALLAKGVPLVAAGSFGNIFSRNSINNALLGLEIPRLVHRLRARFAGAERQPTRRTGWTLTWDVKRSIVEITEGRGGETWTERVGELPPNVQAIIAAGGLEAWVKAEVGMSA